VELVEAELDEAAHQATYARGAEPLFIRHAQLTADFPRCIQLAAREGVRQDVGIARAVGYDRPIADADKLGELLELKEDSLHETGLGSLVGQAEGRGERIYLGHH
jgi:hypothetical protein